jgi:hypothetical protein
MGFDIMLDAEANAWLIETNELPSFETDSTLDLDIKLSIVKEALAMVLCVRACVWMHSRAYFEATCVQLCGRQRAEIHAHTRRFAQTPRKWNT